MGPLPLPSARSVHYNVRKRNDGQDNVTMEIVALPVPGTSLDTEKGLARQFGSPSLSVSGSGFAFGCTG